MNTISSHPVVYRHSGTIFLLFVLLAISNSACSQPSSENNESGCFYISDGFGPEGSTKVQAETVVDGLEVPWAIAFLPGGDLLVTERPGRIRLVKDYMGSPELVEEPVADISTASSSEGGLLGMALHPQFESNRLLYIYVTVNEGNGPTNQVEQWLLSDDGTSATREKVIFNNIGASRNHNGGRILFGPDNMLYVGTGDASDPGTSQDPESPNGKLLRLTPDGQIPDDNPVAGSAVFLSGIRNTQGWAWPGNDANTIWISDHGPSGERLRYGHDEVSIATAGDNLGWPDIYKCESSEGMITPSIVWQKAAPPGGATVYMGDAIPEWKGSLLVATLGSTHLQRIVIEDEEVKSNEVYFDNENGRLREVIMSPEGELFITTSNCDGRGNCPDSGDAILRITK